MHVAKSPLQSALKRQMHGRRDSVLPQPTGVDFMVHCQNVKNTSYVLVNYSGFSGFWPTDLIA